jgi:hypothetical protein
VAGRTAKGGLRNEVENMVFQWVGGMPGLGFLSTVVKYDNIRVVHAFQKKSTHGIKTPKRKLNLINDRLKRLKEMSR